MPPCLIAGCGNTIGPQLIFHALGFIGRSSTMSDSIARHSGDTFGHRLQLLIIMSQRRKTLCRRIYGHTAAPNGIALDEAAAEYFVNREAANGASVVLTLDLDGTPTCACACLARSPDRSRPRREPLFKTDTDALLLPPDARSSWAAAQIRLSRSQICI